VLSYAGYLQGLDLAQLESQILREHLGAAGSVLGAVQADERQDVVDPAAFADGISRSLADGGFRLVIVLDSAPDELIQVVGYLQMVTDKIDIDLVTVTAYAVNGSRVLVPQRIEPARRTREMSDAAVNARQSGTQTDAPATSAPPSTRHRPSSGTTSPASRTGRNHWMPKGWPGWPPAAGPQGSPA
jgi:hypothetical protein